MDWAILLDARTQKPTIWLDVLHKGVEVRFRVPHPQTLGVPQLIAALIGVVLGFVLLGFAIAYVQAVWLAALVALIYGFVAQVPGVLVVKSWHRVKVWFGG